MVTFYMERTNGQLLYDFCFHLEESVRFDKWLRAGESSYEIVYSDISSPMKQMIPVGSLPFVFSFMKEHYGIDAHSIVPIYIPNSLQTSAFLGRSLSLKKLDSLQNTKFQGFIKSADYYKGHTGRFQELQHLLSSDEIYWASDWLDLTSEWRGFVFEGVLLDVRSYSGSVMDSIPDIKKMQEMIDTYIDSPSAYTLDVGITTNGETVILEVHPFVSCGLYGFNQSNRLLPMVVRGYYHLLQDAQKIQKQTHKKNTFQ